MGSRRARLAVLAAALLAAALVVWLSGGFLWPRPQFDRPAAPWVRDSTPSDRP